MFDRKHVRMNATNIQPIYSSTYKTNRLALNGISVVNFSLFSLFIANWRCHHSKQRFTPSTSNSISYSQTSKMCKIWLNFLQLFFFATQKLRVCQLYEWKIDLTFIEREKTCYLIKFQSQNAESVHKNKKRTLQCLHCVQINIDELKLKYLIGPIGITLRNEMTTDKATVYFCYFNWNNDDFLRKSWISFAKTKTNTEKNSSYRFSHFALWIYLLDEKRSEEYEKLQLP